MKAKTILTVAGLAMSIGFAGVIAQAQQDEEQAQQDEEQAQQDEEQAQQDEEQDEGSQNMGINMMGINYDQCMQMMKQAGMSQGMIMRCSMMGALQVDPYDPSAVLAMKSQLSLTADQQDKLSAIEKDAREKAKALLTEDQQNQLKPLLDTPNTMPGMWQQWHSKMDEKTRSAMIMCPWMGR